MEFIETARDVEWEETKDGPRAVPVKGGRVRYESSETVKKLDARTLKQASDSFTNITGIEIRNDRIVVTTEGGK